MSSLNYRCRVSALAALAAFLLMSCENLKRADQADGLLDFVLLATGRGQPDIALIEKATTGGGAIATARALASADGVSVRGSVKKQAGAGWVSAAFSHVDIIVLNLRREVIQSETVRFTPSEIPATERGIQVAHTSLPAFAGRRPAR